MRLCFLRGPGLSAGVGGDLDSHFWPLGIILPFCGLSASLPPPSCHPKPIALLFHLQLWHSWGGAPLQGPQGPQSHTFLRTVLGRWDWLINGSTPHPHPTEIVKLTASFPVAQRGGCVHLFANEKMMKAFWSYEEQTREHLTSPDSCLST